MENSKAKKIVISIWLGITTIISVIFIAICIIAGVQSKKNKPQGASASCEYDEYGENINIEYERAVSYDDDSYFITLTYDEITNYSFTNLYNCLVENINDVTVSIYLEYDEISFDYFDYNDFFTWRYENELSSYEYIYLDSDMFSTENLEFEEGHDLIINLSEIDYSYYDDVKNAIELDIEANQPVPINDSVFETLSDSTVSFIGTISSGITSMVAVFYSDNALTVIGTLAVIVVSITLAYFLFRLIFGLIRMKG